MATIKKLKVVRWKLDGKEVKAQTPGAKKVTEEGSTYFIVWKEGGKTRREATGLTDKRAAQTHLADWIKAREHGHTGLLDPRKPHLDKPILEHLDEYLRGIPEGTHKKEVSRVLNLIVTKTGMSVLRDLTADRVIGYLRDLSSGVKTRSKHRVYVSGFSKWLFQCDRTHENIIHRIPQPEERPDEEIPRARRRYKISELKALLKAALAYPLIARSENKGGRPRKDGSRAVVRKPVKLSEKYQSQLQREGRERQLMYRLLLATGLRRGELSRVTVEMFREGKLITPKKILKVKPTLITHFVFRLPPTLASDLQDHVKGIEGPVKLLNVPCASNLIREHKARLTLAGITYENEKGAVDIHAMRTTANCILKRKKLALPLLDASR